MSARRRRQVGSILREELSGIIQRELKDPRLGFASILRVEISPDMSFARVYISVFGSHEEQEASIEALEHASGFIRHQLAPRLSLRTIPRLRFVLDRSMEHAENISRLLAEIDDDERS
jgi:ribosome-binding factor A